MEPLKSQLDTSFKSIDKEWYTFYAANMAPINRFNNYKWRGPDLAQLTFFEYCMLI